MSAIVVDGAIESALRDGEPVVALETAVLTHGLPVDPSPLPDQLDVPGWQSDAPLHLEVVRAMQRTVRAGGAEPAIVGVLDGTLHIGLTDAHLQRLARTRAPAKAATTNLAHVLATGASGGTTVSGTLVACARAHPVPIRVFATGGIGGVHRDWTRRPDVSADLDALARHRVAVVCAGAKSILDLPATLERLETLGVPVVGWRTDHFPRFQALGDASLAVPMRSDDERALAQLCRTHWDVLDRTSAVLVVQAVPSAHAMDAEELERATMIAQERAAEAGIEGPAVTPFLLRAVAELTSGRSLWSNVALLLANAERAGRLAAALGTTPSDPTDETGRLELES